MSAQSPRQTETHETFALLHTRALCRLDVMLSLILDTSTIIGDLFRLVRSADERVGLFEVPSKQPMLACPESRISWGVDYT